MKTIDIFYQTEGMREIAHLEVGADHNMEAVRAAIVHKHGLDESAALFLEDEDEPVDLHAPVINVEHRRGLKAHLHRCHKVKVTVTFNGETVDHDFSPATTIAKIKKWAAERKFGMSEGDAAEHVLQLSGTHDRPAPNIHVGTLTKPCACSVALDLMPDERVNGTPHYKEA